MLVPKTVFIALFASFSMFAQGPSADSITPADGSSYAQQLFHFTARFSSPHGASFLDYAIVSFDSGPGSLPACQIILRKIRAFEPAKLYLLSDDANAYAGLVTIGGDPYDSANYVSNSQCTIDGADSHLVLSGNMLTLDLAVIFLAPTDIFAARVSRRHQVRLLVKDLKGDTTVNADSNGFKLAGSWNALQ